ncbi:MAG: Arc family DNA-binding protein [Cocleimonas sp.]|nr:Arc family DNA-binding protein [Cocleimonas sp.]
MSERRIVNYTLRISENLRDWVSKTAKENRRSMNAELAVLIETAKKATEEKDGLEKPI